MAYQAGSRHPRLLVVLIAVAVLIVVSLFFLPFWLTDEGGMEQPVDTPIERPNAGSP